MAGNQLSQLPLEIVVLSDVPVTAAVSQVPLEVIVDPGPPTVRVTQDVVEILSLPIPDIRVTQDIIEVLSAAGIAAEVRVTQDIIELLTSNPIVIISSETVQSFIIVG